MNYYDEQDPEYLPQEYDVEIDAYIKCRVTADTAYEQWDEDEDGWHQTTELVDDHEQIARKSVVLPDLTWHKFSDEHPKKERDVIVRKHNRLLDSWKYLILEKRRNIEFIAKNLEYTEWQYVNEVSYEVDFENIEATID